MPEVVSKEAYIENASKTLNLSISEFEKMFELKKEIVDWNTTGFKISEYAAQQNIDISHLQLPFSKTDFFILAEQKMGMNHWELTSYLWEKIGRASCRERV